MAVAGYRGRILVDPEPRTMSEPAAKSKSFKATLNLPSTSFPMRANLAQNEAASVLEQQLTSEIAGLKLAASVEQRRREKAEEEIINNLGDAIMSMRVVP